MPTIVDASIKGKVNLPIIPNVVSSNEGHHPEKQAAGITKVTYENSQRLEAGKGRPHADPTNANLRSTIDLVQNASRKAVQGAKEQAKGMYFSTTG